MYESQIHDFLLSQYRSSVLSNVLFLKATIKLGKLMIFSLIFKHMQFIFIKKLKYFKEATQS